MKRSLSAALTCAPEFSFMAEAVVVDIQNTHEYVAAREDPAGEDASFGVEDFRCWLSPWEFAAYEWNDRRTDWPFPLFCAVVDVRCTEEGFEQRYLVLNGDESCYIKLGSLTVLLDANGSPSWYDGGGYLLGLDEQTQSYADAHPGYAETWWTVLVPVLLATTLMACRNVTVSSVRDHLTRQERRHGTPQITYKVLNIDAMTRILDERSPGGSIHQAMNICRGNFAYYGEEKPLFGKYPGLFWRPMHVRGNPRNGVVIKDYRLKHNPEPL